MTSQVYIVERDDEQLVLKLLTEVGIEDEANGALALRHFDGHGAVRLIDNDNRAHLLEYASGGNLKTLVSRGDDQNATRIIIETIKKLHSDGVSEATEKLTTLRTRFRSLFEYSGSSISSKASSIAEKLLQSESNKQVLHGDLHHENIIEHDSRGWLAIDPKGLFGEITYEAANTLLNPMGVEEIVLSEQRFVKTVDSFVKGLNCSRERLIAFSFVHCSLSAAWTLETGGDPQFALAVAKIAQSQLTEYV